MIKRRQSSNHLSENTMDNSDTVSKASSKRTAVFSKGPKLKLDSDQNSIESTIIPSHPLVVIPQSVPDEKYLDCPSCLDNWVKAYLAPCGHFLCKNCIRALSVAGESACQVCINNLETELNLCEEAIFPNINDTKKVEF